MKIIMVSDTHGHLPKIPACDLFIHAGDIIPATEDYHRSIDKQDYWINTQFKWWIEEINAKCKIFISGNHDFLFEKNRRLNTRQPNIHYLQDSYVTYRGIKIYGSPYTLYYYGWAWNRYELELEEKWKEIPLDTDILVTHGSPLGYGDYSLVGRIGSMSLTQRIIDVKPKLVVCGHSHAGFGVYQLNDTRIINCAYLHDDYKTCREPIIIEY